MKIKESTITGFVLLLLPPFPQHRPKRNTQLHDLFFLLEAKVGGSEAVVCREMNGFQVHNQKVKKKEETKEERNTHANLFRTG